MSIWKAVSVAGVLVIPLAFGAPAAADNKNVILEDESFSPREVNINPGDSVTWRHRDEDTPHSVTFEDGYDPYQGCSETSLLINNCMEEGDTTQRTFLVSGPFRYYCRIHRDDGMTGVVNVVGPSGTVGTTTTTRLSGSGGSSSSSSSSTTAPTELVVSTSTTRPAMVASIPTTTMRQAISPVTAPPAPPPALNPEARDNTEALAALPEAAGGDTAAGSTDGGDSGGSLGLLGGLAVAVAGAAGVLAWKFRPRGRIA